MAWGEGGELISWDELVKDKTVLCFPIRRQQFDPNVSTEKVSCDLRP